MSDRLAGTCVSHYVNERRVWCPPMCPYQSQPRPKTGFARMRWRWQHRKDKP